MPQSIEIQLLKKIKKARRGALFFVDSFVGISNPKANKLTGKGDCGRRLGPVA